MSYTSGIRDEAFGRLGVYARWWYDLAAMKGTLDGLLESAIEAFDIDRVGGSNAPTDADKLAYESYSAEIHRQKDALESLRASVVNMASEFCAGDLKGLLDAPCSSTREVLDFLIDRMADAGDKVRANTVLVSNVTEDVDNSAGSSDEGFVLPAPGTPTQAVRTDCFSLVCSDDSTVDAEQWALQSGRLGRFPGTVTTGVPVDWPEAGLAGLVVHAAPAHDEQGDSAAIGKASGWTLSGAIRGANVSSDGRAWLAFHAPRAFSDENDEFSQLGDWTLDTLVFGEDTDSDGKVYVTLARTPSAFTVLGGAKATIDSGGLLIEGAGPDNTDAGTLYAKVTQAVHAGNRDFTVQLYSDSARSAHLQASGTVAGVADGSLPVAIPLTAESGGVSGEVVLESFQSATDEAADATILIRVPLYVVRLYRSAGRASADLVAEGVSYGPSSGATPVDIVAAGGSEVIGTVGLNYVQDADDVVLTLGYSTVDLYRADPSGGASGIVARAGSFDNLCTEAAADLAFYAVGDGLGGATVDLSGDDVSDGAVVSVAAGFAAGDRFAFSTSSTDLGRFQTFLIETQGKVFPAGTGAAVTVSESLAGAS